MSIMAKTPSGYKKIGSAYLGERPVDKVFNANGDVVYALQRELTGVPPLLFKGKEQSVLQNYRIYGNTVDGESVGDRTANLFDYTKTNRQIHKLRNDDGTINAQTTQSNYFEYYIPVKPNTTYTVKTSANCPSRIYFSDSQKQWLSRSDIIEVSSMLNYRTFTTPNNCYFIQFQEFDGYRMDETTIILVEGSEAPASYEPYGYKVPVTVEGKNLLLNTVRSQRVNGVRFTPNSDGSVTCNGQASSLSVYKIPIYLYASTLYILNGCPFGGSTNGYSADLRYSDVMVSSSDIGTGVIYNCTRTGMYVYGIRIAPGYACNNLTFYPMIRKADIEDDTYEPYHAPVTAPIYLPEPIKMEAHQADFVDYATQTFQTRKVVYGWHVDPTISNSFNAVTYLEDAVGMTPAAMGSDTFSYGSWEDAFFMPKPCMLKSDGTVDYYLNPNDYTKKADGTPSDVANSDYDGNAMMEWSKIWYKFAGTEIDGEGYFYVSNYKVDDTYHCWCNIDSENNETDHFYTAIYNGTGTTKLRSISGIALTSANGNGNTDTTQEITRATANNTTSAVEWYTEVFSDKLLINALLVLMGKSLNTQVVFGKGLDSGGQTAKEAYITGTLNDKGLFWGVTANGNSAVKVFGMENWWGCVWHRVAGCINVNNTLKVKLTYNTADGSTTNGYNQTGSGYIDNGNIPTSSGFLKTMRYNGLGYSPSIATGGSGTTYYGDYFHQNIDTRYLVLGGASGYGVPTGAFYFDLGAVPSTRSWAFAAALSCKPLAGKNPEPGNIRSVSLTALPIIKGTNAMRVDTEVQPSRMDIEGRIKTLT